MLGRLYRRLVHGSPGIRAAQAREIAFQVLLGRGAVFDPEDTSLRDKGNVFQLRTNRSVSGGHHRVIIDAFTGEVIEVTVLPR